MLSTFLIILTMTDINIVTSTKPIRAAIIFFFLIIIFTLMVPRLTSTILATNIIRDHIIVSTNSYLRFVSIFYFKIHIFILCGYYLLNSEDLRILSFSNNTL